jgi:fructose-1,6-bisphosphatase/inositol monophosphatase family enzyme
MSAKERTSMPSHHEFAVRCRAAAAHAVKTAVQHGKHEVDRLLQEGADCSPTLAHDGHTGDQPSVADVRVDRTLRTALVGRLEELLGNTADIAFVGEEGTQSIELRPGMFVAVSDPIDGTTVSAHRGDGYCSALVLLYVDGDRRPRVVAAAIATPIGHLVEASWTAGAPADFGVSTFVVTPPNQDAPVVTEHWPLADSLVPGDPGVVAAVAAKPSDRGNLGTLTTLLGSKEHTVYTQGGNPTVVGLLRGGLGATLTLKPARLWDAVYLLLLEHAGGHVVTFDGRPLDVRKLFESVSRSVPPCIGASNPEAIDRLLTRPRKPLAA